MGWHWHQLDHMQIICTSLQTDNHASSSPLSFYRPDALPAAQSTASKPEKSNYEFHRDFYRLWEPCKNLELTQNPGIHLFVEKPVLTCFHKNPGIHLPVKIHNTLVPVQNPRIHLAHQKPRTRLSLQLLLLLLAFSALALLVGRQEGHPACKNGVVRYWLGCLSRARSSWCHCHPIISCSSKIQNGLPFWCRCHGPKFPACWVFQHSHLEVYTSDDVNV